MKYKITVVVASLIIAFSSVTIYAANHNKVKNVNPFLSSHIILKEQAINDGRFEELTYEIWYDGEGRYKSEIIEGQGAGSYELWDGDKLYQYIPLTNELYIRDLEIDATPIPHKFLGSLGFESIKNDINDGKLKLKNLKSTSLSEYFADVPNSEGKKISVNYVLEENFVKSSSYITDEKIIHKNEIVLKEKFQTASDNFFTPHSNDATIFIQP